MHISSSYLNNHARRHASTANFFSRQVAAALVAVILLCVAILVAYHGTKKEIKILVDGKQVEVQTFAGDVGTLLRENGITLDDQDRVVPARETRLEEGMTVTIHRAVPVTLQVGEEKSRITTAAATVGDILREKGVALGDRDIVEPAIDTPVQPGMLIRVDRVTTRIVEEEVPIPNKIIRESDKTLHRGIIRVVQQGSQGLERRIWQVVLKNGKETEKRLLASNVIKQPVDRVVRVGVLQTVSRGGYELRFSRAYDMVATAYTYTGNNTRTGVPPRVGTVAVDPSVIPLGSRLYIEGYGYGRAMDVGSKIKGNRIDVFMETHSQALRWGRRTVKVYLLE